MLMGSPQKILIGLVLAMMIASSNNEKDIEYLSDIPERILSILQGWGETGWDVSAHAPWQTPLPLQIKDKTYKKGIGHHAPGEIVVALDGLYELFEAEVGVQWQGGSNVGSVVFQIFLDGKKVFDSGVRRELDPPLPVRVPLKGAKEMRLVVTDAGDGIICDCADWAEARLTRSLGAQEQEEEKLDISPFAQVITCDPHRYDGARCSRVEEFPSEDVFLEEEILPNPEGYYEVSAKDLGCIGLRWHERRRLREVGIEFPASRAPQGAEVQAWFGESPWQGRWEKLKGEIRVEGNRWVFPISWRENPGMLQGTEKIRWIIPTSDPLKVKRLFAFTNSRWDIMELRLEVESPHPFRAQLEIYNGEILKEGNPLHGEWDISTPLSLKVRYSKPQSWKYDRTLLRIRLPQGQFCLAVEDLLSHKAIYIPQAGLFAVQEPARLSLREYKKSIARGKTILDKVREMPDQRFSQAMEKVHRPVQDNGPTMLSLAWDNAKFVVEREGSIRYNDFTALIRMGEGGRMSRHLWGGWLPVPEVNMEENGLVYTERTFVAPYGDNKPLCVALLEARNESDKAKEAKFQIKFLLQGNKLAQIERKEGGIVVKEGEEVLALCALPAGEFLIEKGTLLLSQRVEPRRSLRFAIYIPAWKGDSLDLLRASPEELLEATKAYWENLFSSAMRVEIPEPLLQNVIYASQVHCLIAARNEENGKRIAPWIASMSYGPLESEAHSIIYGMDLFGWHDFARRGLEFFIHRYNEKGFLTTGYTLMGTGWHLWTLAEHYRLTRDREWLSRVGDEVARVCEWIMRQREKTKKKDPRGEEVPEYGLMPPGVGADWNRFAYRLTVQGHFYAGLARAGEVLREIGHPKGEAIVANSEEFRRAIRRAYRWNQERSPVLPLSNGKWIPLYPSILYCFGKAGDMFPGEDGGRSWCYDVELGAHHLIPLGVWEAKSEETENMLQHMEDYWFLHSGMGEYPEEENRKDWFNLGGFSKVQPYYTRVAEIYAMRDEVKPFIRSYFNAIPSLLNTENLSFWEHFHNMGAWNKTHETGWFLVQTRNMFLREEGDSLWLAPFLPSYWMEDGKRVSVRNAPTRFGRTSYWLRSKVKEGIIEATILPPRDEAPKVIFLRVRHPEGKHLKAVFVNGKPYSEFDPRREVISLPPNSEKLEIVCKY